MYLHIRINIFYTRWFNYTPETFCDGFNDNLLCRLKWNNVLLQKMMADVYMSNVNMSNVKSWMCTLQFDKYEDYTVTISTLGSSYLTIAHGSGFSLKWVCPSPRVSLEAPYCRSQALIEGHVSGFKWRNAASYTISIVCYIVIPFMFSRCAVLTVYVSSLTLRFYCQNNIYFSILQIFFGVKINWLGVILNNFLSSLLKIFELALIMTTVRLSKKLKMFNFFLINDIIYVTLKVCITFLDLNSEKLSFIRTRCNRIKDFVFHDYICY